MPLGEPLQLRQARHGAVGIGDLADDADRLKAREPAEVHRRLGLARADEHAALARAQGEDVAGLDEIGRPALRVGEELDRPRPVGRADAGRDALARVDAHRERGPEPRLVARDHLRKIELLEALGRHRDADDAARVLADERDVVGVGELRGEREVALVLPVLVVDDDDHPAAADVRDGLVDGRERRSRDDDVGSRGHDAGSSGHHRKSMSGLHQNSMHVLRDHVRLEVHGVTRTERAERRA